MALQETPAQFPGELGSPGSQQPARRGDGTARGAACREAGRAPAFQNAKHPAASSLSGSEVTPPPQGSSRSHQPLTRSGLASGALPGCGTGSSGAVTAGCALRCNEGKLMQNNHANPSPRSEGADVLAPADRVCWAKLFLPLS